MGSYATTTALEIVMVGTTFDSVTTALCSKLITHAENEVNKYISKRYDVSAFTTTSIPPLLTSLTETLAEGYMYQRMARGGKDGLKHGETLINMVLGNLQKIADRELDLLSSAGSPVSESASASYQILSNTTSYSPTFNEDDPLAWEADQDKLDAIEDGRD